MTKKFISDGNGNLKGIEIVSVNMEGGRPVEVREGPRIETTIEYSSLEPALHPLTPFPPTFRSLAPPASSRQTWSFWPWASSARRPPWQRGWALTATSAPISRHALGVGGGGAEGAEGENLFTSNE